MTSTFDFIIGLKRGDLVQFTARSGKAQRVGRLVSISHSTARIRLVYPADRRGTYANVKVRLLKPPTIALPESDMRSPQPAAIVSTPKPRSLKALEAYVLDRGARDFEVDRGVWDTEIRFDAPAGKRYANQLHFVIDSYRNGEAGTRGQMIAEIVRLIDMGATDCDEPDCEWWDCPMGAANGFTKENS